MRDHVICCRYDTVIVRGLVERLRSAGIPYVVIEADPTAAGVLHEEGISVVVGEYDSRACYAALRAETARLGVEVRLAMRPPLWRAGQLDRIHELYREAEQLATRHAMPEVLDTVYAYMVQYHWAKGNPDRAIAFRRCSSVGARPETTESG